MKRDNSRISRSDSLALVALVVSMLFYVFVPTFWLKLVALILGVGIIFWILWRSDFTSQWRRVTRIIWATILSGLVLWPGYAQLFDQWHVEHFPPSGEGGDQDAHMSAQLVVDSVTANETDYRLILENGPLIAKNIRVFVLSKEMKSAMPGAPEILNPGEKREFPGMPIPSNTRPLSLDFMVTFDASNVRRYARFNFLIFSKVAEAQPFYPTASVEGLGDFQDSSSIQEVMDVFANSTGTIIFWFPEMRPDGSPNQIVLRSRNRQLLVNSITRRAAIQGVFGSIQRVAEQRYSTTTNGVHAVAAQWNDQKSTIGISVDNAPLTMR